jgi:hypothetical protein
MSDKLINATNHLNETITYLTEAVRDLTYAVDRAAVELNRINQALDTRADDGK